MSSNAVDAIVIGAGFGGLRMLFESRRLNLSVKVIEAASDVGGTWYWNRYPGARTDTEAWVYAFAFSKDLQDEWDWSERFPGWRETLAYLRHVVDQFEMRRDIQFDTRVTDARWDEAADRWVVTTDQGECYTCSYLITATGVLSEPYRPDFPGLDEFTGDWYLTGRWPDGVDLTGKRVAVIGTGATGVQLIPVVAHTAEHVTVFQRTPNYVLPARNYTLTADELQAIRANYDEIWAKARQHFFGFPWDYAGRVMSDVSAEECHKILERGWESGGFRFIFETFDDLLVNNESNEVAAEFIRDKIRTIVHDPETAELLCPNGYPLAGKRPPLGHFYYETFNRDNVSLVDVSGRPITGITANGVRVGTDDYEVDVIVFATGFDAATGSFNTLDIRGRNGVSLQDSWKEGPRTHLGISVPGFPNMFMISGPQSPFANIPVVVDGTVDFIGKALTHLRENDLQAMEATPEAVAAWGERLDAIVNATVLSRGRHSWFLGDNVPGKPHVTLFYFGGAGTYRQECEAVAERGYEGFALSRKGA